MSPPPREKTTLPALTTTGGFSPQEMDSFQVYQWRGIAAHHKTYAHLGARGRRTAWEACKTFADLLIPHASPDFLKAYRDCRERRARGEWPVERLFYAAELEMKRQKRLGRDALTVSAGDGALTRGM